MSIRDTAARDKSRKPRLTVKDLARSRGMSVFTVSRAFQPRAIIAEREAGLRICLASGERSRAS
jgi:hypothetical protein